MFFWHKIVWFQKISILPPQKGLEIPGRRGVLKSQKFKLNWNFQRGGGVIGQIPSVGGGGGGNMDIFWNHTLYFIDLLPKISPLLAYSVTKYNILSVSITCCKTNKNRFVHYTHMYMYANFSPMAVQMRGRFGDSSATPPPPLPQPHPQNLKSLMPSEEHLELALQSKNYV